MEKLTKYFLPITSFILSVLYFVYFSKYGIDTYQIIAIIITITGYLLWLYSRYSLGKAYSLLPEANTIISTGSYSKIRHPLYASQMITLGGFILFIGEFWLWVLFVLIFIFQLYRIKQEESVLTEKFGDKYLNYKKTTWF